MYAVWEKGESTGPGGTGVGVDPLVVMACEAGDFVEVGLWFALWD